ncbi:DUF5635 domain-containing protein [Corynebacterium sp.]|uniref:DUF5635 domain-containing protein n=1 Tax=Corynebacterium sp. TaxID=1720 RepID=UPI0026E05B2E|nr:DUF5635 domain-containing protein [Corynebacterium sp.]MDO5512060.1 DUF5635 domain-containing protein [Corynebacterium sp.]
MAVAAVMSRRQQLENAVWKILDNSADGRVLDVKEIEGIDFKEEAGRRNGAEIEPGSPQNQLAAVQMADEVACFANTPNGGALILGVEDGSGQIIGTELDRDWLRQRVYQLVSVAPDIVEKEVEGQRLLILFIAESREPVPNTGNALRWRIGDSCEAVDRAEWWERRDSSRVTDDFAQPSAYTVADVASGALHLAREWTDADPLSTDEEVLRTLGVLRSDGRLSEAGALLFVPQGRNYLEFTTLDVPGGAVTNRIEASPSTPLLEQLDRITTALEAVNTLITQERGLIHRTFKRVPSAAVRESILNGIIHRDWNRSEPTDLRWIEADSTFIVRSPGGFFGSVNEGNVLSNREARYPAVADVFRSLKQVDKQGVGVDRMYQSMIVLGHRPPTIHEIEGRFVECTLTGGQPVLPVVELVDRLVPVDRQRDYRVAIIVYLLLHEPFITVDRVARMLQSTEEAGARAIETARQTSVDGEPLVDAYKGTWVFGTKARARAVTTHDPGSAFPLMSYTTTEPEALGTVVTAWLNCHNSVTTGDLMTLTGISRGTVKKYLDDLLEDGELELKGAGRSTRYERPVS